MFRLTVKTLAVAACCLAACCVTACGGHTSVQTRPAPGPVRPLSDVAAFMGDSITQYWDLAQYDPAPTLNFGVAGDTTAQMLARFDEVISAAPGVVVIQGGINDIAQNAVQDPAAPAGIDNIKAMAAAASAAGIRAILCSITPTNYVQTPIISGTIEDFNRQLLELAQASGYLYADYYDVMLAADGSQNTSLFMDGVHPNAAGYAKMWAVIEPLLRESLQ
jgi:lysophospholipase L1-like esterase